MAGASDVVDPLVGVTLGKDYRVVEPIGFGGMAVVYLVEHQTLLKQFAAKVLSTSLAGNREARARFTQEAHAASQLDHENIVNISDFGVTFDQRPFFVMELLRGQTLGQRIAEGAMTLEEIVAIMIPVGRALAFAHGEGIVHRDVKPENIFLVQRTQGRFGIKVVDFGIAKSPVNPRLTKMGETLGSPYYMAPESCRGDDVDHRADQYSFGVILYQLLTGRLPFEDENLLKVLQLQVHSPLPPVRDLNPDISEELAQIIERTLEKDPDARFPSMDMLLAELEASLPPGADKMLIEVQTGMTSTMRATPFPGASQPMRVMRPSSLSNSNLPAAAPLPPAPQKSKTPLYVVGGLALVAVLLMVVLLGRGDDADKAKAPMPVAAAPDPAPPEPVAKPAAALPPREVVPAAPETIAVKIVTTPAGAQVSLDGEDVGSTPLSITQPRGAGDKKLVIKKTGYAPIESSLSLADDYDQSFELARVAVTTARPQRPARPTPSAEPKRAGSGSATPPPEPKPQQPALDIKLSR